MSGKDVAAIAQLIASRIRRPNPVQQGTLLDDLGLTNGTPAVTVRVGDAARLATYLAPTAIQPGEVWVMRAAAPLDAPLVVIASNYKVASFNGGLGTTPLGTGPLGGIS